METSLALFIGPMLMLIPISLMFFGAFVVQVYVYWYTYEADRTVTKVAVVSVLILECIHTAVCMHFLYMYFMHGIADPVEFLSTIWSAGVSVYLEVLVVSIAQSLYITRIWYLSRKNKAATAIPAVLLLLRIGLGFASAELLRRSHTWGEFRTSHVSRGIVNVSLILAAVVDFVSTTLLTFYLRRWPSKYRRTHHMMEQFVFYAINTGAITVAFSLTTVLLFNFVSDSLLFAGMAEVISKLYANTTLALLNARSHIRARAECDTGFALTLQRATGVTGATDDTLPQDGAGVRVDIYKEVSSDKAGVVIADQGPQQEYHACADNTAKKGARPLV